MGIFQVGPGSPVCTTVLWYCLRACTHSTCTYNIRAACSPAPLRYSFTFFDFSTRVNPPSRNKTRTASKYQFAFLLSLLLTCPHAADCSYIHRMIINNNKTSLHQRQHNSSNRQQSVNYEYYQFKQQLCESAIA
jgi:hypothetical protein